VGASAAPYGFTLTIWTTGAIITHEHGVPDALEALLFMIGSVVGFMLVGFVAFGDLELKFTPEERHIGAWGVFHLPSVGLAIALAWIVARIHGATAWPLAGLAATCAYLSVVGLQLAVAESRRRR